MRHGYRDRARYAIINSSRTPRRTSSVVLSIALFRALMMWFQSRRGRDYFFFGVLLATNSGFAAWATGGLETSLFTALVSGTFLSLVGVLEKNPSSHAQETCSPLRGRDLLPSAVLLVAASLTRPEGVLLTVLTGLFLLVRFRRRSPWRALLMWGGTWLLPYAVYTIWRITYYGHIFPNTFYVKAPAAAMIPHGIVYILFALQRFHFYLLLLPGVILVARRRSLGIPRDEAWLGATLVLPYLAYVCVVGGDFMDLFRFLVPVLPIILLAVGQSWRAFYDDLNKRYSHVAAVAAMAMLLVLTVGLNLRTSWDSQKTWYRHGLDSIGLLRQYKDDWTLLAQQLKEFSRPTDTLAITAAGIIPYYTELYTLDQLGLTAPDLSRYVARPEPRPGHTLLLSGPALLESKPQYILGHPHLTNDTRDLYLSLYIPNGWFDRVIKDYRRLVVQLDNGPRPRFAAYAVRNDVSQRAPLSRQQQDGKPSGD